MKRVGCREYRIGDEYHLNCWRVPKPGTQRWRNLVGNLRAKRHDTFTFIDEYGQVLGIGGLVYHNAGNAEAWNYLNDEALKMPALPRAVRTLLHALQEERGIVRMWAYGDPDEFDMLSRWFRFLGLEYEGRVEAWGPNGKDADIFVRIRR